MYALSACIYGDGGHFVELVARDFTSNRLLFCDGMTYNALERIYFILGDIQPLG